MAMFFAMAASVCFYAAGLLMNDLADFEEDRRERPLRPLPSGETSRASVRLVMMALAMFGLAFCAAGGGQALLCGAAILCAITAYNLWLKKIVLVGALAMGLCRGLNLLLGAAFAGWITTPAVAAACLAGIYIAAVTNLARHETKTNPPRAAMFLPLAALALGALAFPVRAPHVNSFTFYVFYMIPLLAGAWITARLFFRPNAPLPPVIGSFIRVLLPLQAAFCAGSNTGWIGGGSALALLALAPISRLVGRRFYAS